jgi:hypothetical protein
MASYSLEPDCWNLIQTPWPFKKKQITPLFSGNEGEKSRIVENVDTALSNLEPIKDNP